ncbi:MAG: tetratricopeptide repeat protein [Saprospiraceae bacterium]
MSEKDIDLIERFFESVLDEAELAQFSTRLETDPHFEKQVAKYEFALQTATAIYEPEAAANNVQLRQHWKTQLIEKTNLPVKRFPIKQLLAIAASLLFVLALGWWSQQASTQSLNLSAALDRQTLKMENFDIAERGDIRSLKALQAYGDQDYQTVLSLTTQINSQEIEKQLLRGRAFIQLSEFEKAIPHFETVIKLNHIKKDEAIWNLALIHFNLGNTEKCKSYLSQIVKDDFGTKEEAEILLRQMEK